MLTKLSQLKDLIDKDHKPKKLVLAASEDAHSLNAVMEAARQEIIVNAGMIISLSRGRPLEAR